MINYHLVVLCLLVVVAVPRVVDHISVMVHRAPFRATYTNLNHHIGWLSFACCLYFFMNGGAFL